MAKRGTRVSVAQKSMKDPELISMFHQMVGVDDPDPNIVIPKYERIYKNASTVVQLLDKFVSSPVSEEFEPEFPSGFEQIRQFVNKSQKALEKLRLEENDNILSGTELHTINSDPSKLSEFWNSAGARYKTSELKKKYSTLKTCELINEIVMIARSLKQALMLETSRSHSTKHDLEDRSALSPRFIIRSEGDYLTLFNFTNLDFKQLLISDTMNDDYKKYILLMLHIIYNRSIEIVKDITDPDIDVDKFSELIINNIDTMRAHIPRCDKAFDKIKQSVGMFRENFGTYYKDFVVSQNSNPGIIVENFVLDVANSNKADMTTAHQFRQIVIFYQNKMNGKKIKDPRVQNMLKLVGQNLDILENKLDRKSGRKSEQTEQAEQVEQAESSSQGQDSSEEPENM